MKNALYIFFLLSNWAFSQQKVGKDSIVNLDEVILHQINRAKQATGITPSTIIGTPAFDNFSPEAISTQLNQVSGVYVLSGALNTNRITIRGVGSRTPYGTDKVSVYYDGIPITNGSGFSTIEAYDLENLNAIEVIKGPKGTAFGANLGGTILLKPDESINESTTLQNNFTVGSYGLLKNNLSFTHKKDKLSLGLRYGLLNSDGFRENNQFKRDGIMLNATYALSDNGKIGILLNYIDYTAYIASSIDKDVFYEDPSQAAFTWKSAKGYEANNYLLAGLSITNTLSPRLTNTTSVFYTYLDHYEPRPFNILDEITNGYGLRTHFNGNFLVQKKEIKYTFGAELYQDHYDWATIENLYKDNNGNGSLEGETLSLNEEERTKFNAYGTLTYPFTPWLTAQVGLAINKTNYDYTDLFNENTENRSGKRSFDVIVLPNFQVNYRSETGQIIYANISKGYSNPSLEETLTPDGIINPDIAQETGINYEIGGKLGIFKDKLKLNAALYQMDIKNMLVAQRVGEDQYVGINAGSTKHQGLELALQHSYKISPKLLITPNINYAYSNHKFMEFIDEGTDYGGNPLTGVPKHNLNTGLGLEWQNGLSINTIYEYVSQIPLTDANSVYSKSYNLVNLNIGYKTQFTNAFSLEARFGIQNLTDTHYARSVLINANSFGGRAPRYYYPGMPRNYFGSLRLRYAL